MSHFVKLFDVFLFMMGNIDFHTERFQDQDLLKYVETVQRS